MIDNESARRIEILNTYLGMNHRTEPYDLIDTSELKDALKMAVAAYCDYAHYNSTLYRLVEWFDESLEHFDTVTWVNMVDAPGKTDNLAMMCVSSLYNASNNFSELADRAEEKLSTLLKVVMTAPDAVQLELLGQVYDINADEIDSRLEGLFYYHTEATEYQYAIDDSFDVFLNALREWSELGHPTIEDIEEPGDIVTDDMEELTF